MKKKLLLVCLLFMLTAAAVSAYDSVHVAGTNYSYLFNIYNEGEKLDVELEEGPLVSTFNILNNYRLPLFVAAKNWADVINGFSATPVSYSILSEDEYNASAYSPYTEIAEGPYRVTYVNAQINGLTPIGEPDIQLPTAGLIFVGLGVNSEHPGWAPYTGSHGLNHSTIPDLNSVMSHELMHSLGVSSGVTQLDPEEGDDTYYFSINDQPLTVFDKDLRVYQGSMSTPFDASLEVVPEEGMSVGEDEEFDIFTYSPYFVGEDTLKVLSGKGNYEDAKQAIIDNGGLTNYSIFYEGTFPQVYGLPIHPADYAEDTAPDLSHLELRNSFMSHQDYRNWLVPMEAELAVLKDIGYDIELRRYFGKSYYLNGITDTFTGGYSEWDGSSYTGIASSAIQGVGLHIYGNNNIITQASDILTGGEGSFGVRIDGVNNKYTLQGGQFIASNGFDNIGLGVTWGQNHQVTIESGASVTATADDGLAVSFDFGENLFGSYDVTKGSYIFYDPTLLSDVTPDPETSAALVDKFDVAGTLTGGKAAIYISDNAYVKAINLLDGAQLNGDIISQWNSVSAGPQAHVQIYDGSWRNVNPKNISDIYFTQLNVATGDHAVVNGSIDGSNEVYNTLQLNNAGNLDVNGTILNVNSLNNTGILTVEEIALTTQTGEINGDGMLYVAQKLDLSDQVNIVENTVSLASGALLSTLNDKAQKGIDIDTIKSTDGKLSFDLGDTLRLQNEDIDHAASIEQIKVSREKLNLLNKSFYTLFDTGYKTLDLGTSASNVYYNGMIYTFTQDPSNLHRLLITTTAGGELGDAAQDPSAANYIVANGLLTKNAGTVKGNVFEISGKDIDVNGHNGLVVDATNNASGTTLRTGISGAADSDVTVQNGGELTVVTPGRNLTLGQKDEVALTLAKANVMLQSADKEIIVGGSIQGTNYVTDIVEAEGAALTLNKVANTTLRLGTQATQLNDKAANTVFELNAGVLHAAKDAYLADAANNQVIANGGSVDLINGQATDITLDKMTLQQDLSAAVEVDLQTLTADRFVFQNSSDLDTQSNLLHITQVQLLHPQAVLDSQFYVIPFVSKDYHNEDFLGGVEADLKPYTLQTPIFFYDVSFEQNDDYAGVVLSRGSNDDYRSYNPAVLASPIAAQLGGYLGQLSVNEQAFARMDTYLLDVEANADTGKSWTSGGEFFGTLNEKERANIWASPYASRGKVSLKKGPKVTDTIYGTAAGVDSTLFEFGNDWNGIAGLYVAYNGSHQTYKDISIRQNGGWVGVSGMAYNGNFFAGLLAGGGLNSAKAKTDYGSENWSMMTASVAARTGYNWELGSRGEWLLQPEVLASYTWVNTPDYNNAADVKMKADPMQVVTLQPQLRILGRFQELGQPYTEIAWVGNVANESKFQAEQVNLPEFSVKPFMKYAIGVRQVWAERWGGFVEVYLTSGGVRGGGAQLGFSYAL